MGTPSTSSRTTVAFTISCSGTARRSPSRKLSAIAKHDECAAATSSSGLVIPPGLSVRAAHVTGSESKAPLLACTVPRPRARVPSQTVCAVRSAIITVSPLHSPSFFEHRAYSMRSAPTECVAGHSLASLHQGGGARSTAASRHPRHRLRTHSDVTMAILLWSPHNAQSPTQAPTSVAAWAGSAPMSAGSNAHSESCSARASPI